MIVVLGPGLAGEDQGVVGVGVAAELAGDRLELLGGELVGGLGVATAAGLIQRLDEGVLRGGAGLATGGRRLLEDRARLGPLALLEHGAALQEEGLAAVGVGEGREAEELVGVAHDGRVAAAREGVAQAGEAALAHGLAGLGERLADAEALLERRDALAGLLAEVTERDVEGEALVQRERLALVVGVGRGGEQASELGAGLVLAAGLAGALEVAVVEGGRGFRVVAAGLRVGGDQQRGGGEVARTIGQLTDGLEGAQGLAGVEPGLGLEHAQAVAHAGESGRLAGLGEACGGRRELPGAQVLEAAEPLGGATVVGGEVAGGEKLVEQGRGGDVVLALAGEDRVTAGAARKKQRSAGLGDRCGRWIARGGVRGVGGGGVERRRGVAAAGRECERQRQGQRERGRRTTDEGRGGDGLTHGDLLAGSGGTSMGSRKIDQRSQNRELSPAGAARGGRLGGAGASRAGLGPGVPGRSFLKDQTRVCSLSGS